jgi:DNA (cytosine-5)-methyltransferase 1
MKLKASDLFAGLGGFTEAAIAADIDVVWAANHSPIAVQYHKLNHPETEVVCQDLQQANFYEVPKHDILLASPCCQGHTPARGKDQPHHDKSRSTAWAVLACAEAHREEAIVVENVKEFMDWTLYPVWKDGLHRLGYSVAEHVVDAADYGVPQHRVRAIIVATKSKNPLYLDPPKQPHVPARSFIEWDDHKWFDIADKVQATQDRAAAGRARFGDTFLMPFYGSGSGKTGRSLDRPIGTITTLDRWALVRGDKMRILQPSENRAAMGMRSTLLLPKVKREAGIMIGNAVCPPKMTAFLNELQRRV